MLPSTASLMTPNASFIPKSSGRFVREGEDEFGLVGADILDAVHRAGRHKEHLAGADDEALALGVVGGDGDEHFTAEAVAQFVGIGVPVRLAHPQRFKHQTPDRQPLQDRQIAGIYAPDRTERAFETRIAPGQCGDVAALGCGGHLRSLNDWNCDEER